MATSETLYERLRRLAVEDPKTARTMFLEAFEANDNDLPEFLERLRKPGEARLRQVVANALRAHPQKNRLVPELLLWRDTETDEFTRRAIAGALAGIDASALLPAIRKLTRGVAEGNHRRVQLRLRKIATPAAQHDAFRAGASQPSEAAAANGAVPDIQVALAKINDALLSFSRELEATDADPQHFEQRSIALGDWLRQMDLRYTSRYSSVNLKLINVDNPEKRIVASDYLLEIVFWNIWLNAHQAAGANCSVTVIFETAGNESDFENT